MNTKYCNLISLIMLMSISGSLFAQINTTDKQLDVLLIQGGYNEVISKCSEIVKTDSLNPEIYFKLGLAYQALMLTDKSVEAYQRSVKLAPDTIKYSLSLAKVYYSIGKTKIAQPIFTKLCAQDSLNWMYCFYLTDIYMQKGLYKNALPIYSRFYAQDTTNTLYIDKLAFCYLRMENYDRAISLYEKSKLLNSKNITALKNLSYLYFRKNMIDTAIYQLNKGIEYDSTDMDLFFRRAEIYYSKDYHFKSRPDYLRVLESGDSSKVILKKIGIGLAYNDQPIDALNYLLPSYQKDSSDYETTSYIGQSYYKLKQYRKSIKYYDRVLKILMPISKQVDYTNILLADSYRDTSLYNEAIKYYTKSLDTKYAPRICLTIANLYDEKIRNYDKAIFYYQLFFNNYQKNEYFKDEYIGNIRKRLNWLIENKDKKKGKNT
ncbi:MAG: tetratricopeptide repeat protein [Bacteroidales bacterium]|nr:tetratricopeptide repeat protein [Bacteroidales bacterium]